MKKAKKTLIVLLLSLLLVTLLFGCADKEKTIDVPTAPEGPIKLNSANFVSELTKYCHSGASFVLDEDIVLTGEWTPIGRTFSTAFNGTLDGNGHKITGLKTTGWESDGTPVTIAKRILGWKADGTPVYSSHEVIDMKTKDTAGYKEVTSFVLEGEDADPDYRDMVDNGVVEQKTSYGSVGLFGYTNGATIKDLTVDGADFEFYGEGDNVYAGIVSGYDVASDFTSITLTDCSIRASSIGHVEISYFAENARPSSANKIEYDTKQYLGGIVGYSRGNAIVNNNAVKYKTTNFTSINVNNIVIDNNNYSAYFDSRFDVPNADKTLGMSSSILATELTAEEKFGFYSFDDDSVMTQAFIGGVSAYSVGASFADVLVDGLNRNVGDVTGRKLNAGGISAALLGAESNAKRLKVAGFSVDSYNVDIAAMIGGAFGEIKSAVVSENAEVKNGFIAVNGKVGSIESSCVGGFTAYADENASLSDVSVDTVTIESNYTDEGKLGSILGGAVGVLRDGSLNKVLVNKVDFMINNSELKKEYYRFVRTVVAQVYGNSVLGEEISSYACRFKNASNEMQDVKNYDATNENALVYPVIAKNNYVNENGESSVRLYYTRDGKQSGVYVTVYGDLVPLMKETGYRLFAETLYIAIPNENVEKDANNNVKADGTYYYYYVNGKTGEAHWNNIHTNASDDAKGYRTDRIYGLPETWYRVELPSDKIGTSITGDIPYYTYDEKTGKYAQKTGTFGNETYYVRFDDANVASYELDITVYSESDKEIVVVKGKTDDDDVTAKATYSIAKSVADNKEDTVSDIYGTTFSLCAAEKYVDFYFEKGVGFKTDKNGFAIKDAGNAENRNFSSYELLTGRPNVGNTKIEYKIELE